jgi:hypothetical protein
MTASRIIDGIRKLYPSPWIVVTEVSSYLGEDLSGEEDKRRADILVAKLGRSFELHGFEEKNSAADLRRETPEKSAPFRPFCSTWSLVVPAPRKLVIPDLSRLPRGWGLLEVGSGRPVEVVAPVENMTPRPPTSDLLQAIIRAVVRDTARAGLGLQHVTRPNLSHSHCGLSCGHAARKPKDESKPVPCPSCAIGAPMDLEVAEAVIQDAEPADLRRLQTLEQITAPKRRDW